MKAASFALILFLAPTALQAQNPVKWTLGIPRAITVAPGSVTKVPLSAKIENGWRVYSLTQKKGGPFAMTISMLPGSPMTLAGAVSAPIPAARYDSSFRMTTETYSGAGTFVIPLRAPTAEGPTSSTIKIRYQACNARFCLPPRNELIQLTATVKSGK
jgi:hypothetical protein